MLQEIPVQAPWSFGPIPPGDFRAPSYEESVAEGVEWAVNWILAHTNWLIVLIGYSQGAECAARIRMEFEPGGRLAHLRQNYCAGVAFGPPSRYLEHTFHGGPPTDGEGIAVFRLPAEVSTDDWCDLVDTYDMYGGVPARLTGEIMRDVYTMCTQMEMHSGAVEFAKTFAANCLEVVQNLDGDAYDDLQRGAYRHGIDLSGAEIAPQERIQLLGDKISVRGIAAAIEAAVLAIQFFCWQPPTAPHIEYHVREVFPGQTYVQLGIQHVHDWVRIRTT